MGTYITDSKREKMQRTKSQIGENMYLINQKEIFFLELMTMIESSEGTGMQSLEHSLKNRSSALSVAFRSFNSCLL